MTFYASQPVVFANRSRRARVMGILVLMVAVLSIVIPTAVSSSSHAFDFIDNLLCGNDLGGWTSAQPVSDNLATGSDTLMANGGKYSVDSIYGNVIAWTTWNGRKPSDTFSSGGGDLEEAAKKEHNGVRCVVVWFATAIANIILWLSGLIVKFIGMVVTWAVNPSIICQEPGNPDGEFCIDLLSILGGDGSTPGEGGNSGIIGTLYTGVYLPLAIMVGLTVAVYMVWKGAIKRELRSAWFGFFWALFAFGMGVFAMTKPLLLAKLPMQASTTIGSCIIESINGRSCLSSEVTSVSKAGESEGAERLCLIDPAIDLKPSEHLAADARMAVCKIWKAFVLEPWSQGQFASSYEGLERSGKDMPVSLTGKSVNELCEGSDFHNMGLYQLNLMSYVHPCGGDMHSDDRLKSHAGVFNDWVYLIEAVVKAKDGSADGAHMYQSWAGNAGFTRISMAMVAVFSACLCASILVFDMGKGQPGAAILALAYLFMGTILTLFAPLFMLAAIHPTTGRRIFLGWLELEIGCVLKYTFMILWISIVVEIYGAILGSTDNAGLILIFVVAMTTTLKMYQPELLQAFGKVDLGGYKLSNAMGNRFNNAMNGLRQGAGALAGGFAAGALTAQGGLGARLRGGVQSAGQQGLSHLARKGGVIGNAAQTVQRQNAEKRQKVNMITQQAIDKANAEDSEAAVKEQMAGSNAQAKVANAVANGITTKDADGNDVALDYNNTNAGEINMAAQNAKDEVKNEYSHGVADKLMNFDEDVDKENLARQNAEFSKIQKRYGEDKFKTDENGVMSVDTKGMGSADAIAAQEYVRRENEKNMKALEAKSTGTAISPDGRISKAFSNADDQAKYAAFEKAKAEASKNNVQRKFDMLDASAAQRTEQAHLASLEKEMKQNGDLKATDKLTMADAHSRGDKLQTKMNEIDTKRNISLQALSAQNDYKIASMQHTTASMKAKTVNTMAENYRAENASGKMWSKKDIEAMNNWKNSL